MTFRYVSNNGDAIEFGGASPYFADPDAFRDYEVDYNMVRNTVTRFSHEPASLTLPITISADTEEEGAALLDRLQKAFEHDVRAMRAGRFEIDDYWAAAFVSAFVLSCDDSFGLWEVEVECKVLLPDPVWVLERTREFSAERDGEEGRGLNYPHNYPFNFYSGVSIDTIDNDLSWACPVRIVIYGAATNPYIYIGDNRYEVDVEVPEGGLLVIDGLDKSKIELRDRYGNTENVFAKRISGAQGSGTYVFEPIPPGVNPVTWDGSFSFDVILCGERSFPPCTT